MHARTGDSHTTSGIPGWQLAMADLEQRHTRALTTLEQNHGDRLARLEERLAAVERLASDLGGQIREMR